MNRTLGIVLAGSYQWGRSSFEALGPRPLVPVGQQPLISYACRWLARAGISEATICANSSTAAVRQRLGRGESLDIRLTYYEDYIPRGAAGCVRDAAIEQDADTFIVVDGASIPQVDLAGALAWHAESKAAVTIVVEPQADRGRPDTPIGIYLFERRVFEMVPMNGFHDIKETLIPKLYRAGEHMVIYRSETATPRVLDGATYLAANHWATHEALRQRLAIPGLERSAAIEGCLVDRTARVDPSALIVGPVLLGPNVHVMAGAAIVGPASLGAGAVVRPEAVVSRSVVCDNAVIGACAFVDQTVVAEDITIDPGLRITNRICSQGRPAPSPQPTSARWALLGRRFASPLASGSQS